MGLHDGFGNGQSQAGAAFIPVAGRINPVKALKDAVDILAFDTRTAVLDRKFDAILNFLSRQVYLPALRGVMQGVIEDICQNLGHANWIDIEHWNIRCNVDLDFYVSLAGNVMIGCLNILQQLLR
jgi:hypothetical protein